MERVTDKISPPAFLWARLNLRFGRLARIGVGVGVAMFGAIQFYRPTLDSPPVVADLVAPPEVQRILRASCYDCHSNETNLRWFDKVAPPYWMVVKDVRRGRAHMNFSDFGHLAPGRQKAMLYEAVNQIQLGAMPPRAYTLVHRDAVVSETDLATLKHYLAPNPENHEIAGTLPAHRSPVRLTSAEIRSAPNGLVFPSDYENWTVVSTTDRFDNGTMRLVLANDRAVAALAGNRFRPWPNGSAFAKIAWEAAADSAGIMRPGNFRQVEFMVKDSTKYASTEGWGWGRWLGEKLTPYGERSSFTDECTACHAPMADNDFVYSLPMSAVGPSDRVNAVGALPTDLPLPRGSHVIALSIDKRAATTSTTFGNAIAAKYVHEARSGSYPAGAVLTRVTWAQREDPHWFGARLPAQPISADIVTVEAAAEGQPLFHCQTRTGATLQASANASCDRERADALVGPLAITLPGVTP